LRRSAAAAALFLDGAFVRGADGQLKFHAASAPTTSEVESLVQRVSAAAERWLAKKGYLQLSDAVHP
jgi:hypothetical protein